MKFLVIEVSSFRFPRSPTRHSPEVRHHTALRLQRPVSLARLSHLTVQNVNMADADSWVFLTGLYTPKSVTLCVGSSLLYLLLYFVVLPATKPKSPTTIACFRTWRLVHNAFMFLFSTACCVGTTVWLHHKGELKDFKTWVCTPSDDYVYWAHLIFTASKMPVVAALALFAIACTQAC
jgi:hypothetical protein